MFEIGNFKDEVSGASHAINRSRYNLYAYLITPEEEAIITPDLSDGIAGAGFKAISLLKNEVDQEPNSFTRSFAKAFSDKKVFNFISAGAFEERYETERFARELSNGELDNRVINSLPARRLANIVRLIDVRGYLEAKDLEYSAAPGSGKGAIMESAFVGKDKRIAPYSDLFQKLILYHTRNPRVGEKDGDAYHFGYHDVGDETKNRLLVLGDVKDGRPGENAKIYIAYVNKQCQGLAKKDFVENVVLHKKDAPCEGRLEGEEVVNGKETDEQFAVARKIKGLANALEDPKLTFLEGGYSWFKALSEDKPGIYTIFLSPFTPKQVELRGKNQEIINSEFGLPFERFLAYSFMNMIRKENKKEELDFSHADLSDEVKQKISEWLSKYNVEGISAELEKEAVLALGRNEADRISALKVNAGLIESGQFIEELNHLIIDYFKHQTLRIDSVNAALARALAYEVQMKLARDVKRGDISFELKVPAREKEKTAKFDKSEDMFNRVLEGIAQIMLIQEYERDGRGSIVVNSFIWNGTDQEIEARMSHVAEEFRGNYFRYLITTINNTRQKNRNLVHNVGTVVTIYGKDYQELAKYFNSDTRRTYETLIGWQREFKQLLGKDQTLEQLTTFKDDNHPQGTEYFLVTDKNGNYLYDANGNHFIRPRDLCHVDGTWHRSVFMILVDKEGRILIQVRSDAKKFFPGCRDTSASGHLGLVKSYLEGATNETQEEVFGSQLKLDPSRIIRIGEDSSLTVIHEFAERNLKDWEHSSLFVYFVTDIEKTKIKKQESEVKDLQWVELDDEIQRWQLWRDNPQQAKTEGIDYAALGVDVLSSDSLVAALRIVINPRQMMQHALKFEQIPFDSEIVVVADKDGTLTKTSEPIDREMLHLISELLKKRVHFVVLTGAILELGIDNFIKPIEEEMKNQGLEGRLTHLTYYFMSGNGKVIWDQKGERIVQFSEDVFSQEEVTEISRAFAFAFLSVVSDRFNIYTVEYNRRIAQAANIREVQAIFSEFVGKNGDALGDITINNGENKLIILELKNSKERQARPELQNAEFTEKIYNQAKQLLDNLGIAVDCVKHYGNTFVDCNLIDKAQAMREFLEESDFGNPLVLALGDYTNDYAFLGLPVVKGKKLSFLVGEPVNGFELASDITVWPVKGPEGTKQILTLLKNNIQVSSSSPIDNILAKELKVNLERFVLLYKPVIESLNNELVSLLSPWDIMQ